MTQIKAIFAFLLVRQKATRRKVPLSETARKVLSKRLENKKIKGDYLSWPHPKGMKPEDAGPIVKVNAVSIMGLFTS